MKRKLLVAAIASVAAAFAGSAHAEMIAGWDFSQYVGDASLVKDFSFVPSNTLNSNYSDLDPTFGAGAESAAFGNLYFDGTHGSTFVNPGSATPQIWPTAGSLASNLSAPGGVDFDTFTVLTAEGQPFTSLLAMTTPSAVNIVFEATLASLATPTVGSDWVLSLGGKTFSGSSDVQVQFSTDGVTFDPVTTFTFTTLDTLFTANLGAASTDDAFVRLLLNPAAGQPILDNVAIGATLEVVPEPGTAALALVGLIGLAVSGRRRRA